jgi:acyl-CoA synthetase (AMP-forming)/AMP-acid ligase II
MADKPIVKTQTMTQEEINALIDAAKAQALTEAKEQIKAEAIAEAQAQIQADKARIAKENEEKESMSEAVLAELDKSTLARLKAGPQKQIEIPYSEVGDNSPVVVGINGVIFTIPRGKEFTVPAPVYDIWKESYTETMKIQARINKGKANSEMRITE